MLTPPAVFLWLALGWALLVFNRPWSDFLATRRRLSPRQARLLRLNLLYNGTMGVLICVLSLAGYSLAACAFLVTVPLLTLALTPFTGGLNW